MEAKAMKEGCIEFIYRADRKCVEQAAVTRSDNARLILDEKQLCMLSTILKFLFSPEFNERANVPEEYKGFMDETYQFRENAKRDPDRAKITLDFVPDEMPTFSARELKKIYDDMNTLTHRVALDMAMDLGLQ